MIIERPVRQLVSRVGTGCFTVNLMEKTNLNVEKFYQFAELNSLSKKDISYEEVERRFWRTLGLNGGLDDPMYGADMVGSLFGSDPASSWNVNHLETPLKLIGQSLPGVSNSMLYFGCWRAMFAFHTEDMELYSINYIHYGAPKSWYSIPPKYKKRFEVMAQAYYPEEYHDCREFLRHKTSLISHTRLKDGAIPYHMAVQEVGEFMITFPGSYHQGYNHGFNVAEATNFATERWIDIARTANICRCKPDSVNIDMDIFETLYYREKMMKKIKLTNSLTTPTTTTTATANTATTKDTIIDLTDESDCSNSNSNISIDKLDDHTSTTTTITTTVTTIPTKNDKESTEIFNTNDSNETKWLLRCKCGKRIWYPMIPTPVDSNLEVKEEIQSLNYVSLLVAEGEIFQCIECGLWCHIECIYGTECNESNLPEDAKCHMCSTFDIEQKNNEMQNEGCNIYVSCIPLNEQNSSNEDKEIGNSNRNNKIKDDNDDDNNNDNDPLIDDFIDEDDEYYSDYMKLNKSKKSGINKNNGGSSNNKNNQSQNNKISNKITNKNQNQVEVCTISNTKSKSKKYKPRLHDIITAAVYSKTSLKYENITGEVVDIEDSNIRIHVKVIRSNYLSISIYLLI